MVAVGVVLLPVPAVGAHFLDAVLSHPAQLVLGLGGVGVALGDITGAAGIDDLATLTGACVTALGTVRTGMIGNDQEWMNRFFSAATEVHEKIWQLPADEEYEKLLESDVADLKNVGGSEAGAITAGLFLKQFVHDGTPWIHLDIAGPAFNEKADETGLIGATGVGIKSILHLLQGGVASHDR